MRMKTELPARKPFLDALAGKKGERPPFWFMRQAGRYLPEYRELRAQAGGFLDLCFDPELAAEVTLQPLRRFHMDAAILFSDILVIPLALGQEVRFEAGEGPKLPPLRTPLQVAGLRWQPEALAPIYETIRRVKTGLPESAALIGFAGSPWTVSCYMVEGGGSRDFQAVREFARTDPDAFCALLERVTDATIAYLRAQAEAGAEAVQLFDSWAGALSEEEFHRYSIAPTKRIVTELKRSHPHVPVIGFPRRAGAMALDYARQTGVDALSIDDAQPLSFVRESLLPHIAVQGNLDPLVLKTDSRSALAQAERIVSTLHGSEGGKPFIFNLGHGIVQHTPVEHVQRLSDWLHSIR